VSIDPVLQQRIVTRSDALAGGLSRDQIRQRVRSGLWTPLERGTYLTRVEPLPDVHAQQRLAHVDRCVAAVRRHPGSLIAFASSAISRGLPLVSGVPQLGQLAVADSGWTGIRRGVRYRLMDTEPAHVTEFDPYDDGSPIPITTVARTVADIARTLPHADALAAGDAALRLGLATREEILEILTGMKHVRGCRTGQEVVPLLDPRRETALESWSALLFWEWGLPEPAPQVDLYDDEGLIGRVDFYWEEFGVVGEADGRLKYDEPGSLYAEKRREDRLRRLKRCRDVIRWGWIDLRPPRDHVLRDRLRTALR
jgi:hypothetical protein